MVYDNLFWNKAGKDIAFLCVRSVGWNLGTFRELGGAVFDAAGNVRRLQSLERFPLGLNRDSQGGRKGRVLGGDSAL
jgi:hypothetical protein